MSAVEGFDFIAPQFVESLGDGALDDGADKFFDAEESPEECAPAGDSASTENYTENVIEPAKTVSSVADADEHPDVSTENDENKQPELKNKKNGRDTRLQRMSVKHVTPPTRKSSRFMSLAEQVHKFHHATPPRFKRKSGVFRTKANKILPTIAMSPLLQTKIRSRASVAQPVSVNQRPVLKPVKKVQAKPPPKPAPKPPTVPKPFNLTDVNKFKKVPKQAEVSDIINAFTKAKTAFGPPTSGSKKKNPEVTKAQGSVTAETSQAKKLKTPTPVAKTPQKPVNVKKKTLELQGDTLRVTEAWAISGLKVLDKPTSLTKPVPFSFEKRDKEKLKAKQQKLEQAKEDEFKAPNSLMRPSSANVPRVESKKCFPRPSLQNN